MGNYANLKTAIEEAIFDNHDYEISGLVLQGILKDIVNSLGADFQFVGVATPSTNPGTPDQNVAYIAPAGSYPNFGSLTIGLGKLGILKYNGSWSKEEITLSDATTRSAIGLYYNTQAGDVVAKTVAATDYALFDGGCIKIHFNAANTASNPTLNVNGTGAKSIVYNGALVSPTNTWKMGETVMFYYDSYGLGQWVGTPLLDLPDFINVNDMINDSTEFDNAALARAAVPLNYRKYGLQITYLLADGWYTDQFNGDDTSDWGVADNWKVLGPVSVSQDAAGKSIVRIGNDSTTLETKVDEDVYMFSLLKTPIRLIGWKYGQFNLSNIAIGDTFDITNIEHTTQRKWIIFDTKIGDIANVVEYGYHVNNHGYSGYRNWVSLDENFKVLSISEISTDWENAHAKPGPNTRYYILQTMTDIDYYVAINRLSNTVAYLNNVSDKFGHITIEPQNDLNLRIVPASGIWSDSYYSQVFKCNFADCALRIIPKDGQKSRIAFLKSNEVALSQVANFSDYLGGVIEIEQESIIDIPKDAQYIYLYIGNNRTDRAYEPKLFSYMPKTINNSIDNYIANSVYSNEGTPQLVSFLTCTDLHGSQTAAKLFMDILAKYRAKIAFAVHLGDSVMTDFNSDFTFWENSGMNEVINMIGNHDSAIYSNGWSWSAKTKKECYDRYLAPYIANWGVIQPSGVDTPASDDYGACYFYKDIANVGIRFIILDAMHQDTAQETWFANALADAKTNSYSVIVMCHFQSGDVATDDTINWATIDGANAHLSNILSLDSYYSQTLHSFIQNGGDFICWFAGHRHRDDFGYQVEYSDIFNVVEEKAGCNTGVNIESNYRTHDSERTINTPSQISFNFVTIDKIKKTLKVVRLGNNRDLYLRQKNTLCYNYNTKNIISQG